MISKYLKKLDHTEDSYIRVEQCLIKELKNNILNNTMLNKTMGTGVVVDVYGNTFDTTIVCIDYNNEQKKYGLATALMAKFLTFENPELLTIYKTYSKLHFDITSQYILLKKEEKERVEQLKKKQAEELKAEEQYQKLKNNAIKSFEKHINEERTICDLDSEFFYALGWLANNIKTVSAALPDYLERPFHRHFGYDTPCRVVDSHKRGPAGYQSQWTWSFKATLKNSEDVPTILVKHLNTNKNYLSDTSFIWDLIDTYNFKFGKTQCVEDILSSVPSDFVSYFNMGLSA